MRSTLALCLAAAGISTISLPCQKPGDLSQLLEAARLEFAGTPRSSLVSVAISHDFAVVGDYWTGLTTLGSRQGAAYVFEPGPTGWRSATQVATLTISNPGGVDEVGRSVAILGDTVVVGSYAERGGVNFVGAVLVYEKPAGGWVDMTETARLTPSDAGGQVGRDVAVGPGVIVAGGPNAPGGGAVYVYEEPVGGWVDATETARLTSSDTSGSLGRTVALDGDTIVAGDSSNNVGGNSQQGAVYVYDKPAGGWANATETAKLTVSDGRAADRFGDEVALRGRTIAAGARYGVAFSPNRQGAAYVFERSGEGWENGNEVAKLTPSQSFDLDNFGLALAISGRTLVVGASGAGPQVGVGTSNEGIVYLYERPATGWADTTETRQLRSADDTAAGFGGALATHGEDLAVVAWNTIIRPVTPSLPAQTGTVHVFESSQVEPFSGCGPSWTLLSGSKQLGQSVQLDMTPCAGESFYAYFVGTRLSRPFVLPRRFGCGNEVVSCLISTQAFAILRGRRPLLQLESNPELFGMEIAVQGICDEPSGCVRITDMTTFTVSN